MLNKMEEIHQLYLEFKLDKAKFAHASIPILGFEAGRGKRRVAPGKAQALKNWPPPVNASDVVSMRAFASFNREFIPDFLYYDQFLKETTKKGADFNAWWAKEENKTERKTKDGTRKKERKK